MMDYHHSIYSFSQKLLRSKLFFGLELVVSTVLGITLVFPILGTLLALNELLRLCYQIYLWLVYKGSVKLSDDPCGSNYMVASSKDRHTILYLGELEGPLDVETLRENYQKYVIDNPVYSKLTYTLEKAGLYPCLKKCDNFNIKNHIRYYPGTEDRTVTETELLKNILPDLSKDMTDRTKPQWEEVIIPYYVSKVCTGLQESQEKIVSLRIIRIHHSYMDGASTLIMIANTMSERATFPYVIDPCKPLKISRISLLLYKLTSLALFSTTMFRNMVIPPILRRSRFTVDPESQGEILFTWTKKLPIEYFQNIKEKSGVSMPAIVSTVLSGALRKLELEYPLLNRNSDNSKPLIEAATAPDTYPIWMVAGMFPYSSTDPKNDHIVIETQLNTSQAFNCERLSIINDDLGRLAKNPMVTVYYWFAQILGRSPRPISEFLFYMASCPALLSNIPLTTRRVKLWDKECFSIMGWVPLIAKTGLGIVSVRYADHFRYCLQVDSSTMNQQELDYFVSQIEQQVDEIFLETAQLQRKLSSETSLFDHGKENKKKIELSTDETLDDDTNDPEDGNTDGLSNSAFVSNNYYNNNYDDNASHVVGGIKSSHYSFMFKLKDSIEQIKVGIKKIKEH